MFDAAFRKATFRDPIPFYFVIDEAQEIGTGMRLESMLAEGAKFGARMFVLTQSLEMMRKTENMEALVQSLLANTSTQAFFSPDPDDADTIRAILSSSHRYGDITLDLPTLQCWIRARIQGHWQPPTLVRIPHVGSNNPDHVQQVIRDVIAAHPEDYKQVGDWEQSAIKAIKQMIPKSQWNLLNQALNPTEVEYMITKVQQEARDEKKMQNKTQREKAAAEAKGEDPGEVRRPDQNQTKQKAEPKEPLTDELVRFDDFNIDYPQESQLQAMKLLQRTYILLSLIAVMVIIPLAKISETKDTPTSITTLPKTLCDYRHIPRGSSPAAYYSESDQSWSFSAQVLEIKDVSIYGRPGSIAKIEYVDRGKVREAWAVLTIDDYSFSDATSDIAVGDHIILSVSGNYVSSKGVDWSGCPASDEFCQDASFIEGGFPKSEDYGGLTISPSNTLIYSGSVAHDWINGMLAWRIISED